MGSDCDCITHDGPHWQHMDAFWHARNREMLARAAELERSARWEDRWLAGALVARFAEEEVKRLEEKARCLARAGAG